MQSLSRLLLSAFCFSLAGCNMEKEIDLNLPDFKSEITVECYLEQGKPYRATVSESTSYFDRPEPVLVPDATVIITYNGQPDTLLFQPYFDQKVRKFYTHVSKTVANGETGATYALEVFDTRGRRVTGTTSFLPVVAIDSLEYIFNGNGKALLQINFNDYGGTEDFYRFQIYKDSLSSTKRENDSFFSDRLRNGQKIQIGTSYKFFRNDTLFINLFHLEKPYFTYLSTVNDARDANGNPFAQPSAIKSTLQGGIGVFTTLVVDHRKIVLR
jgi:hypothetical protein